MNNTAFLIILSIFAVLTIAEAIWSHASKRNVFSKKETLANLGVMVGMQLLRPISLVWKLFFLGLLEPLQFFTIPFNGGTLLLTFLVVEFAYYWYHRLSHEIPFLWAIHHTHHSSTHFNLTTAIRLNWMGGFVNPIFFLPLVLLGFSAQMVVTCMALNLLFQFFVHTQAVGRLGWLEGIVNTPSAHRVHHGSNPEYLDKNYGGLLVVFDRLFGTYQEEKAEVRYGVTTGAVSGNPFKIVFQPMLQWFRGDFHRERQSAKPEVRSGMDRAAA